MAMESWSTNEYRTFITSRRDDVFENREASAFSFKRASPVEVGRGDYSEKEVYFDTDVKVQWDSMMRMALRRSPNAEHEFEFKSAPVSPILATLSQPDDGVFQGSSQLHSDHGYSSKRGDYKEHPVYRKQAELDDGSNRATTFVVSQRTVPEPFSQMSPHSLSRMYQPKYSKFCVNSTDVPPVETAMDSRSSSFRSQTSICEPGDRDTGDSSTSRDSNGSSNDASSVSTDTTFDRAFDVFDHRSGNATTPTLKSKVTHRAIPCPTDRRSVVSSTNADYEKAASAPGNVSWLRSPLKWKGIFGAKKPPKSPRIDAHAEHDRRRPTSKLTETSSGDAKPRPMSRLFNPPNCDDKNIPSKPKSFLALPVQAPGPKVVDSKGPQGLKLKSPFPSDSSDVHSVVSTDRERDPIGILKIRERWMKYMRMLKPPYGKTTSKTENGAVERGGSLPPQGSTAVGHQEYVHTRAKSMPAILKTPPLRPRSNPVFQPSSNINIPPSATRSSMMPPAGPSSAKKSNSFLAHSGSLVSSSPRLMKSASPRLMSLSPKVMKSSPKVSANTISPRMSSSSSASSMSELHSAVQGAIAHCKQSHSGLLSPAPSAHHY
ncbi:hypothetical protein KC19_1G133400 [Ceratodon purpureus]|uniref:Uncharacterized protein n=1 Tax=Ceratodon purpureus TaxID=3225 RepID=A0A8T0J7R6_CERPU|nr:hypothetical protein KC19_1G133400 [Ceratodon purpureus]